MNQVKTEKETMSVYEGLKLGRKCFTDVGNTGRCLRSGFVLALRGLIRTKKRIRKTHVFIMSSYEKAGMLNPKFRDWRLGLLGVK